MKTRVLLPHSQLFAVILTTVVVTVGASAARAGTAMLLPRASEWKYHNSNVDLGTAWLAPTYDDSPANGWSGPSIAPFGYNPDAPQFIGTVINIAPDNNVAVARYPTIYFRKTINVSQAFAYEGLILRIMADDAAVVYLNGQYLTNTPGAAPPLAHNEFCCASTGPVAGVNEYTYFDYVVPADLLVEGPNVFAVEARQITVTSTDLTFDMEVEGTIDTDGPELLAIQPLANATVRDLQFVTVTFDSAVTGVDAADLLVGNNPATNVTQISPREFTFYFPAPATGLVEVAFAENHGITDTSLLLNRFTGASWSYTLDSDAAEPPPLLISEFMAANQSGIQDEDGDRSDWIEIWNRSPFSINLNGWFLTDSQTNLAQWRFPAVIIPPNGFLLVWASGKNRLGTHLHTNFRLNAGGEYLALVDPQTNVVSEFAPLFPPQRPDVSYGWDYADPSVAGFYPTPTPGAQNTTGGAGFTGDPVLSLESGVFTNSSLTLTISGPPGATIRYSINGSIPTNGSLVYSAPITLSNNTLLKVRAFDASLSVLPSRIVARSFVFLDPSAAAFSSKLPLVIVDSPVTIPIDVLPGMPRAKGSLVSIEASGGRSSIRSAPQFQGIAEFEIFGQTSAGFPKRSHIVEVQDEAGNDRNVSLLGIPAGADWKLLDPYTDKCLMNDFLAYELFEQMGHYQMRRRFVEAFIHSGSGRITATDYYGVMVLVEKLEVKKDRVDIAALTPYANSEPEITGGYIFKKDKDSAGDLNFPTVGGGGFPGITLKIHEPKPREITTPQLNWLKSYLNQMEKSLYAASWLTASGTNHYSHYLDVDSFVDQFWIVEFTKQIDGYRISSFYQKDRGGKVRPEPIFSWKLSFGNADYLDGGHFANWYYNQVGPQDYPWAHRLILGGTGNTGMGDPDFCQKIADRWSVLRTNVLNGPRIVNRISDLSELLAEAAARDFAKFPRLGMYLWPNPISPPFDVDYVHPTNYMGIISEMKKWVNGRYNWIDSQFTVRPAFSQPGGLVTAGTSITISGPPGAALYYTLDGTDPRASGGGIAAGALSYTGPITVNANVRLFARAKKASGVWQDTWSGPAAESYVTALPGLRITEIMYHPLATGGDDAEQFEFIEVQNISGVSLNVSGFELSGGIQFHFPNVVLAPNQFAVIVKDTNAFISRYGSSALILGTFSGNLNNAGDSLGLFGPLHEPILNFSYDDDWYKATDGSGFSLVIRDANAAPGTWGQAASWRASAASNGSPGGPDPAPPARPPILINELLSYAGSAVDAVELYNPTAEFVNVGGWYLTDDFDAPRKYLIPQNTVVPPGGYVTFDEEDFNNGAPGSFAFASTGDDVYLFSGDGVDITGYVHGFEFGVSERDVTFGRHVISTGEEHFVAQRFNTLGVANSGPLVGPIVVTEIMDTVAGADGLDNMRDEFIELHNIGTDPISLNDPLSPASTWRLRDAVEFDFPMNVTIPAGGFLLVVGFDPVANPSTLEEFRQRNLVPAGVPVYGPWSGSLQNGSKQIDLLKPRSGDAQSSVPYVLVERITYRDAVSSLSGGNGFPLSLQRIVPSSYGNDPTNWVAAAPTPAANYVGGLAPIITSQPGDALIFAGSDVTFTAAATGTEPLQYQWRYMGRNLSGATNASLSYTNFQVSQAGIYSVVIFNSGGYALGTNFTITSRVALRIGTHPQDRHVIAGSNTTFSVSAVGSGPLRFRWYHNGTTIPTSNPTATNATLALTNVQPAAGGSYYAVVSDDFDETASDAASLAIETRPAFTVGMFPVTVVEGGTAVFSVAGSGTTPLFFTWRTNGFSFSNRLANATIIRNATNSILILKDVSLAFSNYIISATITNFAGPASGSRSARLFVLPDSDHDGLPDSWEATHSGTANDGSLDTDGDGMDNRAEYIAGTDYNNTNSFLKIDALPSAAGNLQFNAVSNRTYTIQYTENLAPPISWTKLADVLASSSTRMETVVDRDSTTNRFYRLVTPIQP